MPARARGALRGDALFFICPLPPRERPRSSSSRTRLWWAYRVYRTRWAREERRVEDADVRRRNRSPTLGDYCLLPTTMPGPTATNKRRPRNPAATRRRRRLDRPRPPRRRRTGGGEDGDEPRRVFEPAPEAARELAPPRAEPRQAAGGRQSAMSSARRRTREAPASGSATSPRAVEVLVLAPVQRDCAAEPRRARRPPTRWT